MPRVNGKYVTPTWQNGGPPALDAAELKAMGQTLEQMPDSGALALAMNVGWKKVASWEKAGAYTWTAPDLFGGKDYLVGVMIIGAGASGAAMRGKSSDSGSEYYGGPSGFGNYFLLTVHPGNSYALVVGAKGASKTAPSSGVGNNGGASSFHGVSAGGGTWDRAASTPGYGGQVSTKELDINPFGGVFFDFMNRGLDAMACFNPFESKRILGAGGYTYYRSLYPDQSYALPGGKDPLTGLGGGDGAIGASGAVVAGSATAPGCGGGAAISASTASGSIATSGAGADGAVYLYVQGAK